MNELEKVNTILIPQLKDFILELSTFKEKISENVVSRDSIKLDVVNNIIRYFNNHKNDIELKDDSMFLCLGNTSKLIKNKELKSLDNLNVFKHQLDVVQDNPDEKYVLIPDKIFDDNDVPELDPTLRTKETKEAKETKKNTPSKPVKLTKPAKKITIINEVLEEEEDNLYDREIKLLLPQTSDDDDDDETKADFALLRKLSKLKVYEADYILGKRLLDGIVCKKNNKNGITHLMKSAVEGNYGPALFELAGCYQNSIGVKQDLPLSFDLYLKAKNLGEIKAIPKLANMYLEGNGVLKDEKKAITLLQEGVDKGNVVSYYLLGEYYYNKNEIKTALPLLYYAGTHENHLAPYLLAELYSSGKHVPKQMQLAIYWYFVGAQKNHTESQHKLALIYDDDELIAPELNKLSFHKPSEAVRWNTRSALNDDYLPAIKELARSYEVGSGCKEDTDLAKALFYYCARNGDQYSADKILKNKIYYQDDKIVTCISKIDNLKELQVLMNYPEFANEIKKHKAYDVILRARIEAISNNT